MKLEIRGKKVEITEILRKYIERRLGFALDRFTEKIAVVRLKLSAVNGSDHGFDARCRIGTSVLHSSPISLQSRASTLRGSVDLLADRLGLVIARRLERRHEHRHFRETVRQFPVRSVPNPSIAFEGDSIS